MARICTSCKWIAVSVLIIALMFEDHRAIVEEKGAPTKAEESLQLLYPWQQLLPLSIIRHQLEVVFPVLMMGIGRPEHWVRLGDCGTVLSSASCLQGDFLWGWWALCLSFSIFKMVIMILTFFHNMLCDLLMKSARWELGITDNKLHTYH